MGTSSVAIGGQRGGWPPDRPGERAEDTVEGLRGMVLCDGRLLLQLISQNSPLRPALEAFIRSAFQIHFDAQVGSLMPHLVGLYGVNGEIEAAVGLRSAARGALFLEQYLDDPIERIIGGRTGGVVERAAVVEVGNLATRGPGRARVLFQALVLALGARSVAWTCFTGTPGVRAVFQRLGLRLTQICEADPARLGGAAAARWGRYYAHRPRVLLGHVPPALSALDTSLFALEDVRLLQRLARRSPL